MQVHKAVREWKLQCKVRYGNGEEEKVNNIVPTNYHFLKDLGWKASFFLKSEYQTNTKPPIQAYRTTCLDNASFYLWPSFGFMLVSDKSDKVIGSFSAALIWGKFNQVKKAWRNLHTT